MPSFMEDRAFAGSMADIVKALGHPVRLRIIALLCRGEATVSDIARTLSAPPAIVSQQLRILRLSRLVDTSRAEGFAVYRLAEPKLANLIQCLEGCTLHRVPARYQADDASPPEDIPSSAERDLSIPAL